LALFAANCPIVAGQAVPAATPPARIQPVNPLGQWLGWLSVPQIQTELEILPEQRDQLAQLRSEMMEKINQRYQETATGSAEERQQKYQELSQAFAAEADKKVSDVLLPHQLQRLRQIGLQLKMSGGAYGAAYGGGAFDSADVAEALGITAEQQTQMREKQQEIREEVRLKTQEFYRQMQDEAREKLLSVLTPIQRKKLDDLLGPKFEWQQPSGSETRAAPASGKP
jgi:hypothetical protein